MALTHAALVKTSLVDYPGRLSAVIFTPGCNIRCPWCQNRDLVRAPFPDDLLPLDEILSFLAERKKVLKGVVVSGGEPLIHQDLPGFLEQIHQLGLPLKLDTNGTLPERLERLPEGLVDFVAMDLKNSPEHYAFSTGIPGLERRIADSVALIKRRWPGAHEFRTTWVPDLNLLEAVPAMAVVLGPGEELVLTGFRPGETLDPAFADRRSPTREELRAVVEAFEAQGVRTWVR